MSKETDLWLLYKKHAEALDAMGEPERFEKAYRFYEGDQWYGLESGGETLPVYNMLAPLVKYKVATVADKRIAVSVIPALPKDAEICRKAEAELRKCFENISFSRKQWQLIQAACIAGTAFCYFYMGENGIEAELLDSPCVLLANEAEQEIEKQPYILISMRQPLEAIASEAAANGVSDEDIAKISADEEGLCACVLKIFKKSGTVCFAKATQECVYCPETEIKGLYTYPIAKLCWDSRHGLSRGIGEVTPLIPNQIEINRSMARMALSLKNSAYPKLAYLAGAVANPDDLDRVGTPIEVMGGAVSDLDGVLKYLQPGQVNTLALSFAEQMLSKTRELAGQNEAVTGSINPENASGAAIVAARDAAALYLSEPTSAFTDFTERAARIMLALSNAYGITDFSLTEFSVAVEITRCDAYSKFAGETALESLLSAGHIGFEEYVNALEDDGSAPKAALLKIIAQRRQRDGAEREN